MGLLLHLMREQWGSGIELPTFGAQMQPGGAGPRSVSFSPSAHLCPPFYGEKWKWDTF